MFLLANVIIENVAEKPSSHRTARLTATKSFIFSDSSDSFFDHIPELSSKDIENYLLLLICQLQLKKASFQTLIEIIHSQRILLKETPLAWDVIEPLLDKTRSEFELSYNMNTLKSEIECISEIAHIVSGSLKGNPRQTKRFLNTFYVRKSLAALYFGEEISLPILAKLAPPQQNGMFNNKRHMSNLHTADSTA